MRHVTKTEIESCTEHAQVDESGREETGLNATKRYGNNKAHRPKAKRVQERKTAKASRKRNR